MSVVPYGNLRAEIVDSAGIRLQRMSLRQAATNLLLPGQPEAPRKPPMLGRTHEVADAYAVIRAGWPVGFHSACGYGKTTLLRRIRRHHARLAFRAALVQHAVQRSLQCLRPR